jgi:two-component system chemotaxis sensor kinase CheA
MSKYRAVFLEEAAEHLEEMSRGLLELERDPARAEAIDLVFRMAHSIKGMAASLGYDPITELAHRLEDRMQGARAAGRVEAEGLALLFKGLESLETLLAGVRDADRAPPADPWLLHALAAPPGPAKKKAQSPR